jgi:GGDEF domain-containing protein
VRSRTRAGFPRHPLMCDWAQGLLSQPCVRFGLPPARVEETECQARGGSQCRYVISWDKDHDTTIDALVKHADTAMYEHKARGRLPVPRAA